MGLICYYRNELDVALEHISNALKYLTTPSLMNFLSEGYRIKAFICQAMGDSMGATQSMEAAQNFAIRSQSPFYIACADNDTARLILLQGAPEVAARWGKKRNLHLGEPFSEKYENECLILAHLRLAQKQYESVVELMGHLRPRSLKRHRMESVIKIDIIYSAALYALKKKKQAISVMEKAIGYAGKEGYIRPFVDYAPFIGEILIDLRHSTVPQVQTHVMSLIESCGLENITELKTGRVPVSAMEYLTPREVELLTLMADGYSNTEIAEKIFVSLSTVKKHINHIFGKLNVRTRTQAVLRAKQMDLSSPERSD